MTTPEPFRDSRPLRWSWSAPAQLAVIALASVILTASPVLARGHTDITLVGAVEVLPSGGLVGDWTVAGKTVHVTASTAVDQDHGSVAVGVLVKVEGTLASDGSVDATTIEVKGSGRETVEFTGAVESLPGGGLVGDWIVAGKTVHVTASTVIDQKHGTVAVGVVVEVKGMLASDGSIDAATIRVEAATVAGSSVFILKLQATPDAPAEAEGVVVGRSMTLADGSLREDLKVAVENLLPSTAYEVIIDTVHAGTIMTDDQGEGMLFLSTADIPAAQPLPPELQDFTTLTHIDVADASGTVMLTGDFADAHQAGQGSAEYFAVAPLHDPDGALLGVAMARAEDPQQSLDVQAWGLAVSTPYNIVVDGIQAAAATTNAFGKLRIDLSTGPNPEEQPLPTELQPVSALIHVEIQAIDGTVVASGDFIQVSHVGGGTLVGPVRRKIGHH